MAITDLFKVQDVSQLETFQKQLENFKNDALVSSAKFVTSEAVESVVNRINRAPWILTCDTWLETNPPEYIVMNPNPKDIDWEIPTRSSQQKTASGTVTYTWRDPSRQGTIFDEPILNMTMQSGSLLPRMSFSGKAKDQATNILNRLGPNFPGRGVLTGKLRDKISKNDFNAPPGIEIFYQFLQLFNVARIHPTNGEPNFIRLILNTVLFPKLTIKGMFATDTPLQWAEASDNPTSIEWKVKLIVTQITPNIGVDKARMLVSQWKQNGGGSGFIAPPQDISTQVNDLVKENKKQKSVLEKNQKSINDNTKKDDAKIRQDAKNNSALAEKAEQYKENQQEAQQLFEESEQGFKNIRLQYELKGFSTEEATIEASLDVWGTESPVTSADWYMDKIQG